LGEAIRKTIADPQRPPHSANEAFNGVRVSLLAADLFKQHGLSKNRRYLMGMGRGSHLIISVHQRDFESRPSAISPALD
jgi:hypothetical protein